MIMANKKSDAAMIIASMGPKSSVASDSPDEPQDGKDAAAQEVLSALDSKDPAALKSALESFVSMCMDSYESDESAEPSAE